MRFHFFIRIKDFRRGERVMQNPTDVACSAVFCPRRWMILASRYSWRAKQTAAEPTGEDEKCVGRLGA